MATKKTSSRAPAKEQKHRSPSISARIDRLVDYENTKVKAIASANIGGAFAIHGIRVIDSHRKGCSCRCHRTLSRRTARPSIRISSIL